MKLKYKFYLSAYTVIYWLDVCGIWFLLKGIMNERAGTTFILFFLFLYVMTAGFDLFIFIESEQEIEKEDWRSFLMELYVAFFIFVVLFMGEFVRLFTEIIEFLFKSF